MMSISSQGGGQQRRPSVVATGKKAPPRKRAGQVDADPAEDRVDEPGQVDETSPETDEAGSPATGRAASKTAQSTATGSAAAGSTAAGSTAAPPAAKAGGKTATGKAAKSAGTRPGATAGKAGAAKSGAAKFGEAAGKAAKPGSRAGGKSGPPRRPIAPVKVSQGRNWGPIALFVAVGLVATGIIGWGAWAVYQNGRSWEDRAAAISDIVNYRETNPNMLARNHKPGDLQYEVNPPVGGDHSNTWQRCMGDVYDGPVASENAVHSLEHGAVWLTYRPDLPRDQVDRLASKVRGQDYVLMSPFPDLDRPISLQAWGYQLKVDDAGDGRIDEFISALRENASQEPGAVCSAGNYTTGADGTPRDLSDQMGQNGGMPGAGG
jgi:Protein of unknown function (DUF3105)